jgi:hypothetical protein
MELYALNSQFAIINLRRTVRPSVDRFAVQRHQRRALRVPSHSRVPFRLNAFEQFGVRSIQVVSEFHRCLQSFRIHLETFS